MIEAIGVENIRKKSLRQTKLLLELVDARGFFVNSPRDDARRGGTVCFDFPAANAVTDELRNRRYLCDWRPRSGLRASPHFYTSDDEIHRFIEELDHVRRQLGPVASSNPIASV
jgi:kynureninase